MRVSSCLIGATFGKAINVRIEKTALRARLALIIVPYPTDYQDKVHPKNYPGVIVQNKALLHYVYLDARRKEMKKGFF